MNELPGAYGIQQVPSGTPGALTCGECGRSWLEDITPAGRCPWEDIHGEPDESPTLQDAIHTIREYLGDAREMAKKYGYEIEFMVYDNEAEE